MFFMRCWNSPHDGLCVTSSFCFFLEGPACCGTGVGARVDGFELGARERSLKVPYLAERELRPVEARIG